MNRKTLLLGIKEAFFPDKIKCIMCDDEMPITTEECICENCLKDLPFNDKFCPKCGRYFEKNSYDFCYDCNTNVWNFNKARSVFLYKDNVKRFIQNLKYNYGQFLKEYCALFLSRLYKSEGIEADFITFVPMHPKKQKQRGYNQAQLIAVELGNILNIPTIELLVKNTITKKMSSLNKADRKTLIKGSFSYCNNHSHDLTNKNILLVDDLFTTGSTSDECASVLKQANCGKIFVMTVASQTLQNKSKTNPSKKQ